MNADGTGARRITPWKLRAVDIDRLPDGWLISSRPEETGMDKVGDIYTVRPDGSDLTRATDSEGDAWCTPVVRAGQPVTGLRDDRRRRESRSVRDAN